MHACMHSGQPCLFTKQESARHFNSSKARKMLMSQRPAARPSNTTFPQGCAAVVVGAVFIDRPLQGPHYVGNANTSQAARMVLMSV